MTLVAGFRCRRGGVLLCADRQEDDGYNKREVDKIYRIPVTELQTCDIFLAGDGSGDLIRKFQQELHESLAKAATDKRDVFTEHKALIEWNLGEFHKRWGAEIKKWGLTFIVVVAPYQDTLVPMLYRSSKAALIPFPEYCASGAGRPIADYFADRLFQYDHIDRPMLTILAAFILREAEESAAGVKGGDIVIIHDDGKSLRYVFNDRIKELQREIPPLQHSFLVGWQALRIPDWLATF
jgi:hypothetical protein